MRSSVLCFGFGLVLDRFDIVRFGLVQLGSVLFGSVRFRLLACVQLRLFVSFHRFGLLCSIELVVSCGMTRLADASAFTGRQFPQTKESTAIHTI